MVIIEEQILKKTKTHPSESVSSIIPLAAPENNKFDALEYIDHTCHNTLGDYTSGKSLDLILVLLKIGSSLWT